MNRRELIALLGGTTAVAWPFSGRAQPSHRIKRFALLTLLSSQQSAPLEAALLEGLRRLGYVEGQNVQIDYRYAAGDVKQLKRLALELVSLKPDVVLAAEPSPARAMKSVAPMLPIVCVTLSDALIPELAASYARPGGSVTGIAQSVEGVTGKLVELTLEIVPNVIRIGFLSNPEGASMRFFAQAVADAARARRIAILTEEATTPEQLAPAFNRLAKQEAQAVIVPSNGLFRTNRVEIGQLALAARVPTISPERESVEAGGLASYGIDAKENYRHAATYVDKILKGANPGELPIEFPTRVELVVNLKTAKALGLEVPAQVLGRADEVIE